MKRIVKEMEDNENPLYLSLASKWTREYSGFGKGRALLALGDPEGEALIKKHLLRIAESGFAPGQEMAERYPLFFSPRPQSPAEQRLFAALPTFENRPALAITEAQMGKVISLAKGRFRLL